MIVLPRSGHKTPYDTLGIHQIQVLLRNELPQVLQKINPAQPPSLIYFVRSFASSSNSKLFPIGIEVHLFFFHYVVLN
jgi:hypothetical protein